MNYGVKKEGKHVTKYERNPIRRKKCRGCKKNTETHTVRRVPYITARGIRKVLDLKEWQNWCIKCLKLKVKDLR